MDYIDHQNVLRGIFNLDDEVTAIPGTETRIFNCKFRSEIRDAGKESDQPTGGLMLRFFEGNSDFTYPVFMPGGRDECSGALILLHGLNERSWGKYLYWAQYLAEHTGKAVILFPIAWHVNRSPHYWADPRLMQSIASERSAGDLTNRLASSFNAALSTRLDMHPEWFCTSGLQTCYDIISLSDSIRCGNHPLFTAGTTIDFFAYSVGAFLLEVLLIANPDGLYSDSRSFLFLGGSSFEQMKGISKYIMDSSAFNKLENAFIHQNPMEVKSKIHIPHLPHFNILWTSFMSMLRMDRLQALRERSFYRLSGQISAIGLARDQVIPGKSILRTLWGAGNRNRIPVSIMDFPYPYVHENPFPMNQPDIRLAVDHCFNQVFIQASRFLAG